MTKETAKLWFIGVIHCSICLGTLTLAGLYLFGNQYLPQWMQDASYLMFGASITCLGSKFLFDKIEEKSRESERLARQTTNINNIIPGSWTTLRDENGKQIGSARHHTDGWYHNTLTGEFDRGPFHNEKEVRIDALYVVYGISEANRIIQEERGCEEDNNRPAT